MLTRTHRFHGRSSLAYVYRSGATARAQHLALRFIRNARISEYRVAIIVSRKVHKSAVARNRLRRRLYEIVRIGPEITEPYDLVITVFSEQVSDLGPQELTRLVTNLFTKAGIYSSTDKSKSQAHAIVRNREEPK